MAREVFDDLYSDKPGGMLERVPSFTTGMGNPYDRRSWTYVHLYEALEMLIIRLLKSLNALMLEYLENAGARLLAVSRARMIIRTVMAASPAYKRVRVDGDADGDITPLHYYDKQSVQSSSVRAMVNIMREKGFLSGAHRECDRLRNVSSQSDLENDKVQQFLLDIDTHGRKSAELDASAMFPEVFGPLSDSDVTLYLNKKRPKGEWTTQRVIPNAGEAMADAKKKDTSQAA